MSCNEDDKINNCKLNSELFSNYFLTTAEQITHNIFNNHKIDCNNTKNPVHNLSRLFKNPFPQIKFSNTSTKETEKIISSLQSKNGACCGAVGGGTALQARRSWIRFPMMSKFFWPLWPSG